MHIHQINSHLTQNREEIMSLQLGPCAKSTTLGNIMTEYPFCAEANIISLTTIPDEILLNIIRFISLKDISLLSIVSAEMISRFTDSFYHQILKSRNKYITKQDNETWRFVFKGLLNQYPKRRIKVEPHYNSSSSDTGTVWRWAKNTLPPCPIDPIIIINDSSVVCSTVRIIDPNTNVEDTVMAIRNKSDNRLGVLKSDSHWTLVNFKAGKIEITKNREYIKPFPEKFEPTLKHKRVSSVELFDQTVLENPSRDSFTSSDETTEWIIEKNVRFYGGVPLCCSFGNTLYCVFRNDCHKFESVFVVAYQRKNNNEVCEKIWETKFLEKFYINQKIRDFGCISRMVANNNYLFIATRNNPEKTNYLIILDRVTGKIIGLQKDAFLGRVGQLHGTSHHLLMASNGSFRRIRNETKEHELEIWVISIQDIIDSANTSPNGITEANIKDYSVFMFSESVYFGGIHHSPDERYIAIKLQVGDGIMLLDTFTHRSISYLHNPIRRGDWIIDNNLNVYTLEKDYLLQLVEKVSQIKKVDIF